jgi:hypothetical protein
MVDGWWLMVDGWWLMVDGWWLMVDGWWLNMAETEKSYVGGYFDKLMIRHFVRALFQEF